MRCCSGIAELHLKLIRMVLVFWPRVDLCQSYNLPGPRCSCVMRLADAGILG